MLGILGILKYLKLYIKLEHGKARDSINLVSRLVGKTCCMLLLTQGLSPGPREGAACGGRWRVGSF